MYSMAWTWESWERIDCILNGVVKSDDDKMASLLYCIFVYSISNYLSILHVRNRSIYTSLQIVKEAEPKNNEYANREPLVFIDHRMCHIAAIPLSV